MKIKHLGIKLIITFFVLALYVILYLFHAKCFFLLFTGYPCPGCGMTRAYLALLHGNVSTAFKYHGMFWSLPILYLYILMDGKVLKKKYLDTIVLVLIAVGFSINYVYHLLMYI